MFYIIFIVIKLRTVVWWLWNRLLTNSGITQCYALYSNSRDPPPCSVGASRVPTCPGQTRQCESLGHKTKALCKGWCMMTIVALILMHANGTWLAMPLRNLHHYYCSLVHARPAGTPWLVRIILEELCTWLRWAENLGEGSVGFAGVGGSVPQHLRSGE